MLAKNAQFNCTECASTCWVSRGQTPPHCRWRTRSFLARPLALQHLPRAFVLELLRPLEKDLLMMMLLLSFGSLFGDLQAAANKSKLTTRALITRPKTTRRCKSDYEPQWNLRIYHSSGRSNQTEERYPGYKLEWSNHWAYTPLTPLTWED